MASFNLEDLDEYSPSNKLWLLKLGFLGLLRRAASEREAITNSLRQGDSERDRLKGTQKLKQKSCLIQYYQRCLSSGGSRQLALLAARRRATGDRRWGRPEMLLRAV